MSDSKRARAFHWDDLPLDVRRRIARRGAGDCRPANSPFYAIRPCTGCNCWLGKAFKNARGEYHRLLRLERLAKPSNHTDSIAHDGAPHNLWASGPDGTKFPNKENGGDWLLQALKIVHPERDPHQQKEKESVA